MSDCALDYCRFLEEICLVHLYQIRIVDTIQSRYTGWNPGRDFSEFRMLAYIFYFQMYLKF